MLETSSHMEHNPNNDNNVTNKDITQDVYGTGIPISNVGRAANQK